MSRLPALGVETFWFQAVCQNHIVWDSVEVVEFARKHAANVHDSQSEIRRIIEALVGKLEERHLHLQPQILNAALASLMPSKVRHCS